MQIIQDKRILQVKDADCNFFSLETGGPLGFSSTVESPG